MVPNPLSGVLTISDEERQEIEGAEAALEGIYQDLQRTPFVLSDENLGVSLLMFPAMTRFKKYSNTNPKLQIFSGNFFLLNELSQKLPQTVEEIKKVAELSKLIELLTEYDRELKLIPLRHLNDIDRNIKCAVSWATELLLKLAPKKDSVAATTPA